MNKKELKETIEKYREEATRNYKEGNIKEGKKWEKRTKEFEELLKSYE